MSATKALKYSNRESWVTFWLLVFVALFGALFLLAITGIMGYVPGLAALIYGVVVTLLFSPLLLRGKSVARWVIFGLLLFVIVALPIVPWTSRHGFVKDLYSIRPGMTVAQVEAIMERYNHVPDAMLNTKRLPSGELALVRSDLAIYRHVGYDDEAFNADFGRVNFENGRVVDVEFLPD